MFFAKTHNILATDVLTTLKIKFGRKSILHTFTQP